jgi:hypothetical protein
VRVEYQTAAGAPLGWVELYHQPRAEAGQDQAAPGTTPPAGAATPAGATPPAGAATPAAGATPAGAATPAADAPKTAAGATGVPEKDEERRPVYLMRTEVTRMPAGVAHTTASRITEDIEQIFGQ